MSGETHTSAAQARMISASPPFGLVDIALVGVALVWGFNFALVKYTLSEMRPLTFNGLRFLLASALTLFLLFLVERNLGVDKRDWGRLLLLGLIGNTAYQIFFIKGLELTKAGNSSLLIATNPIFIALLTALLRLDCITRQMWIGILLSFGGIAVVIASPGKELGMAPSTLPGDGLTLLSAICWAIYAVLSRSLLQRYSALKLSALTMFTGTPFLLLAAVPDMVAQDWTVISWRGWTGLTYSFVLAISLAYIIYFRAVQVVGNARTAIYGTLVPAVAVVASALTLGERITPLQIVGAIVILVGVYLTRVGGRR